MASEVDMATSQTDPSVTVKSPFSGARADLGRRSRATDTIIIIAAVIAGLYFGHEVLVPIALAVLLSFVLAPVTVALRRLHLGRVASVILAVALAVAILLGLGVVMGKQLAQLAEKLPEYQLVIGKKLQTLRSSDFGRQLAEKAANALEGLDANLTKASPAAIPSTTASPPRRSPGQPLPVEVHEPAPSPVQILQSVLMALLPPLATTAIVIIFVVFILLQRQDMRDRFIGLTGAHDLHRTTRALDDAATRLSRYLLALTGINAAFGVLIAIGLMFIGVPNPVLWGIFGGVLRFVPYVGSILAAAFPLALAAAVDPGWSMIAECALLFVVLETIMGQVVEPQLFGHTTGMSPLAIIVAAAFWTLIWGPPGLLLATPLTTCLVVLGRHVESLNFIELVLGDKPGLSPVQSFYQRILAGDPDEVAFQAESLLNSMSLIEYYETVALPALALAQVDVTRGVLEIGRQDEVCASIERVVDDLFDHVETATPVERSGEPTTEMASSTKSPPDLAEKESSVIGSAMCIAGRTPLDRAACTILAQLLNGKGLSSQVEGPEMLTTSGITGLNGDGMDAICILYMDHQSYAAIRYAVRRLRKRFPNIPTAVCLWGCSDLSFISDAARADATINSLPQAIDFCVKAKQPSGIESAASSPELKSAAG
jgi:predicted PurR-regulated permease PerM